MTNIVFKHSLQTPLPLELVESLNHTYFLHVLATEPQKVVPPGKSLLSMLLHSQLASAETHQEDAQPLLERVKEVAHKAFWDEAAETIASPEPAIQLSRLKRLYQDLAEAVEPLLPSSHPVISTLRSPLAPTTSPLQSTLLVLKEMLTALKERCAPFRDAEIDNVLYGLDEWSNNSGLHTYPPVSHSQSEPSASAAVAMGIVTASKNIVHLTEVMKADLRTAVLSSLSESQARKIVLEKAKEGERQFVLRQWTAESESGSQVLQRKWRSWVSELPEPISASHEYDIPQDARWIQRLMCALGSDSPVSCNLPPVTVARQEEGHESRSKIPLPENELPPHFLFSSQRLFYLQNYIQAISIAAALQVLSGLTVVKPTKNTDNLAPRFMERVWALLKLEIEADERGRKGPDTSTKVVNLSDEIIYARRLSSSGSCEVDEEARIRESVDRTLRPGDPVFMLLRRRLVEAVGKHLADQLNSSTSTRLAQFPVVMQSGRGATTSVGSTLTKPRLLEPSAKSPDSIHPSLAIKGFEDPVLVQAINQHLIELLSCVKWISGVWGDLM